MNHNIAKFTYDVKQFLSKCEMAIGKPNKAIETIKMFDYLVENIEIVNLPKMAKFKDTIEEKLIEYNVEKDYIDAKKYYHILFPNKPYVDEVNNNNEAIKAITTETFNEHWDEEMLSVDKKQNEIIGYDNFVIGCNVANENPKSKENDKNTHDILKCKSVSGRSLTFGDKYVERKPIPSIITNNNIEKPLQIIPLLICDCYETNNFTKMIFNTDIVTSVKLSKGDNIIVMDQINNDSVNTLSNYDKNNKDNNDTQFLIKINDTTYDFYEKVVNETINKGYFYNTKNTNVTFTKKCRYGLIYL